VARRLVILGSTGSIGVQALDVISRAGEQIEVVGLAASHAWEPLIEQARRHGVKRIALADQDAAARAGELWTEGELLSGPDGLVRLITDCDCDLVLNAIVGSAGLVPTVAALGEGIDLALANKESLVVGGELVTALAQATGAAIIPVDSEHSALHQLLSAEPAGTVDRLVLTASGGPFRGRKASELEAVSVEEALAHPTWAMGGKITIDSATLMNKGLELIEAHHLFGTPYEQIDVVVHPESIIHSLIQLCDGATLAHLGYPDMRVPIAYALHYPERVDVPVAPLDLVALGSLNFEAADDRTFACLRLAREAARAGGTAPCTLNAANEVAVHAFLGGRLRFLDIAGVIEETLEHLPAKGVHSFESLGEADGEARRVAGELVEEFPAAA
jgi:1-deoxy-D-xylulose-5-phosphate reductoisomerase